MIINTVRISADAVITPFPVQVSGKCHLSVMRALSRALGLQYTARSEAGAWTLVLTGQPALPHASSVVPGSAFVFSALLLPDQVWTLGYGGSAFPGPVIDPVSY